MFAILLGIQLRSMIDPSVSAEDIERELKTAAVENGVDPVDYTSEKPKFQKYDAAKADSLLANSECYLNDEESAAFDYLSNVKNAAMMFVDGDEAPTRESINNMVSKFREMTSSGDSDNTDDKDILSDKNIDAVRELLPDDIGLIYCKYYYDDWISEDVGEIIGDIWDEYIKTFENNTWLDEQTKQNAVDKIKNMIAVVGYPDNYVFPAIISPDEGGTLFNNKMRINKYGRLCRNALCFKHS